MRGRFSRERYAEEIERVKILLRSSTEPYLQEFLAAWEARAPAAAPRAPAQGAGS